MNTEKQRTHSFLTLRTCVGKSLSRIRAQTRWFFLILCLVRFTIFCSVWFLWLIVERERESYIFIFDNNQFSFIQWSNRINEILSWIGIEKSVLIWNIFVFVKTLHQNPYEITGCHKRKAKKETSFGRYRFHCVQ